MDLVPGGIYRHYKGKYYKALFCAKHSETREELVIYQALYDEMGFWARPKSMFFETVTVNGEEQPRFAFVPEGMPE